MLVTLRKLGSPLQGHPDRTALPGIEAATGSLGQGLSISVGLALGLKLALAGQVYCVLGDGEIQEGQVWEAAMSAPKLGQPDHALDNLVVILDYNKIQLDNFVKKVLDLEPVIAKWRAFLAGDRDRRPRHRPDRQGPRPGRGRKGKPTFVVAHTSRARASRSWRNDPEWHGKAQAGRGDAAMRGARRPRRLGGYLKTDSATRAIVDELAALEKK